MGSGSRAVSPVIASIVLIAVVVIIATTTTVFVLGFSETAVQPGPYVAQSSGELVSQDGYDGGIVRLTHIAGDTLAASALEIVVDAQAACGKTGRLVNLPAPGGDPVPESEYVRGDDLFDNSYNSVGGPIGEAGGQWGPGATALFRIAGTPCQLDAGETITVRVVHTPTEPVVIRETLPVS